MSGPEEARRHNPLIRKSIKSDRQGPSFCFVINDQVHNENGDDDDDDELIRKSIKSDH